MLSNDRIPVRIRVIDAAQKLPQVTEEGLQMEPKGGLPGKLFREEELSLVDAACLVLAKRLYRDFEKASERFCRLEPERFAEVWLRERVPDRDETMERSIWVNFVCLLIKNRKGMG